jgi:hypothetical protein
MVSEEELAEVSATELFELLLEDEVLNVAELLFTAEDCMELDVATGTDETELELAGTQMPIQSAPPFFGSHSSDGSSMHMRPSEHRKPANPPHFS